MEGVFYYYYFSLKKTLSRWVTRGLSAKFSVQIINLYFYNLKIGHMKLYETKIYIKIIELEEIYNFVLNNLFIQDRLGVQILVTKSKYFFRKFQIYISNDIWWRQALYNFIIYDFSHLKN